MYNDLDDINASVWQSIDRIAEAKKLSLPRLALSAGLDQSTFCNARRKRNWLSLQTIAKVLYYNDISLEQWANEMVSTKRRKRVRRAKPETVPA